jgi:hypothetical protein
MHTILLTIKDSAANDVLEGAQINQLRTSVPHHSSGCLWQASSVGHIVVTASGCAVVIDIASICTTVGVDVDESTSNQIALVDNGLIQ